MWMCRRRSDQGETVLTSMVLGRESDRGMHLREGQCLLVHSAVVVGCLHYPARLTAIVGIGLFLYSSS